MGKRRVLIVEDDALMRAFYRSLFQRLEGSYDCRIEESGSDAWSHLRARAVDAVVLDWDLPGLTGIEVIRAIRKDPRLPDVAVVMISGRASAHDRTQALNAGADVYMLKPFDVEEFLQHLRRLLA